MEGNPEKSSNEGGKWEARIATLAVLALLSYYIFSENKEGRVPKEVLQHYTELQSKYKEYVEAGRTIGFITPEQIDTLRDLYIVIHAQKAQEIQKKHGIPASVVLAQMLLESDAGTSELASKYHNHFNIKHTKHCKAEFQDKKFKCCVQKTDDNTFDHFKIYQSDEECLKDYVALIHGSGKKNNRYQKCLACGDDVKCWVESLENAGFATSDQYAERLMSLIKKYELAELDIKKHDSSSGTKQ